MNMHTRPLARLRERIVRSTAHLLGVPIRINEIWYGADPVLSGAELQGALTEFFADETPPRPKLRLIRPPQ